MSKHVFIFIIAFMPVVVLAQKIKLVDATCQQWSGGIAGRWGINYYFTIEFSRYKREPLPDTLWLGNKPVALSIADGSYQPNTNARRIRSKSIVTFQLNAGMSHDDYNDHPFERHDKVAQPAPPIKYSGIALLSYKYKGTQHYYQITAARRLPPINYP